ncbi:MAG: hypothetical protein WC473_04800 [Patescibacteria group bacterium]
MICFNCKRQIPDNVPNCPNCGAPVVPQVQVGKEIRFRRWQRWFFYGVIIVLFIAETAYAAKIYTDNAALLSASVQLQSSLRQSQTELETVNQTLASKDAQLTKSLTDLAKMQEDVNASQSAIALQTQKVQDLIQQKDEAVRIYNTFKSALANIDPDAFYTILNRGVAISAKDLVRIPLGQAGTSGEDVSIKQPVDLKFAANFKGKILLLDGGKTGAWYVSPVDGKRYFLGRAAIDLQALKGISEIISPAVSAAAANSALTPSSAVSVTATSTR